MGSGGGGSGEYSVLFSFTTEGSEVTTKNNTVCEFHGLLSHFGLAYIVSSTSFLHTHNLTVIYEPRWSYVRCRTGSEALWHFQECP